MRCRPGQDGALIGHASLDIWRGARNSTAAEQKTNAMARANRKRFKPPVKKCAQSLQDHKSAQRAGSGAVRPAGTRKPCCSEAFTGKPKAITCWDETPIMHQKCTPPMIIPRADFPQALVFPPPELRHVIGAVSIDRDQIGMFHLLDMRDPASRELPERDHVAARDQKPVKRACGSD